MVRTNEWHFQSPEAVHMNEVCFGMLNYVIDGVGLWKNKRICLINIILYWDNQWMSQSNNETKL